ncbi:MAG TPA: GNAT family N-acetyltransferase [Candidatus Bariatricus faecipullorum]|nr:GNAT family N-acetyltransferase [Candidatus Bariatricus faecipullorum]
MRREPETFRLGAHTLVLRNAEEADAGQLMLLAFWDGELAGNCSFTGMPQKRYRHRATVGIALYRKFTGLGIGTVMMETLIQAARNQGLEQLELEVIADNAPAIGLYKKLGFEVCGTLPNNMKYKDGTYADALWMRKKL